VCVCVYECVYVGSAVGRESEREGAVVGLLCGV
jgi:hypothetical protein